MPKKRKSSVKSANMTTKVYKKLSGGKVAKNFMREYGLYVNEDRAVPDFRDGMKPVQRRLLWVLHDNKCTHTSGFKKSARIVGDTLGKYHPHGDCLDGSTKIYCLNGLTPTIKELYEKGVKSVEGLAYDEKNKRIVPITAHSFRIGQFSKETYNIKLVGGVKVPPVTANHPFYKVDHGWVEAEDVCPGDILLSSRIYMDHSYTSIGSQQAGVPKTLIHTLVGNYKYGDKAGDIFYHKNNNKRDNTSKNIVTGSRAKHAKHHKNDSTLSALEVGRDSMFSENGKYRKAIRKKNSLLMGNYNRTLPIRKAVTIVEKIIADGSDLTVDTYEKYRLEVYNGTKISTLTEKGYSLKDIYNIAKSGGFVVDNSNAMGLIKKASPSDKKVVKDCSDNLILSKASLVVAECIKRKGINFSILHYEKARKYLCKKYGKVSDIGAVYRTLPKFKTLLTQDIQNVESLIKALFPAYLCIVESVDVKTHKEKPMYDFTVDKYANMFIQVGKSKKDRALLCVHNSSIYSALVTMANARNPMVEGHGNWGKPAFDISAAASRYTECRLSKIARWSFDCTEVGKFVKNFDDELDEPLVIPTRLPLLFMNGNEGIGVGVVSKIPPFNFGELLDGLEMFIKKPKSNSGDLIKLVKGPDYPSGGILTSSRKEVQGVLKNGEGSLEYSSKYEIREAKDCHEIVFTSFAPELKVNKAIEKCEALVEKGMIEYVLDQSDKKSDRVVIGYKNSTILKNNVLPIFQTRVSYSFYVTKRTKLKPDSAKQYKVTIMKSGMISLMKKWLDYRRVMETKFLKLQEKKTLEKIAREEAILVAIKHIDYITRELKKANSEDVIRKKFMKKMKITDYQVGVILGMPLRSIMKKNVEEVKARIKAFQVQLKAIRYDIAHIDKYLLRLIGEIRADFGKADRKTLLKSKEVEIQGSSHGGMFVISDGKNLRKLSRVTGQYKVKQVARDGEGISTISSHGVVGQWGLMDIPDSNIDAHYSPVVGIVPFSKEVMVVLTNLGKINIIEHPQRKDDYTAIRLKDKEYVVKAVGLSEGDKLICTSKNGKIKVYKFTDLESKRPYVYGRTAIPKTTKGVDISVYTKGDKILEGGKVVKKPSGKKFFIISEMQYTDKQILTGMQAIKSISKKRPLIHINIK